MGGRVAQYPNMRRSISPWLGSIPSGWSEQPGRSLFKEKAVKNSGLSESRVLSLSYGRIVVKPSDSTGGLSPASYETYQIVDPGDIIVRSTDLQNDKTSLRVGLVRDRGIITSAYLCLSSTPRVIPYFGYLLLHAYDLNKFLYGLGSGLRQNIAYSDFRGLIFPVPSIAEQRAIVRYLRSVDLKVTRMIQNKRRLVQLLQEQRSAVATSIVTRGLDRDAPVVASSLPWLGTIPAHWQFLRLKDVATVQTGLTLGKTYAEDDLSSYPYLRVANVQAGRLDLRVVKQISVPSGEALRTQLREGDVLMTEGGDIDKLGRGCVWRSELEVCLHQNHIFAVRCRPLLEPGFLVALMGSIHGRSYFQVTAKQTTNLASTNSTTLRAFPILLPPVEEQRRMLKHLRVELAPTDAAIERAEREIELIREYRTSLVANVTTGKLDAREAAAGIPDLPDDLEALDPIAFEPEDIEGSDTNAMDEALE